MLASLFLTFLKIGLFTFGGGYAMIANIREEIVQKRNWLDEDELMSIIAIAESTPGPIAINMATYVGYKKRGLFGAILSTLGVVLPSFIIVFVISLFLDAFMANKYVAYAFVGIKCAVAFLILRAGLDLVKKLPRKPLPLATFIIIFAILTVLELTSTDFSSIVFILLGGVVGILFFALFERRAER